MGVPHAKARGDFLWPKFFCSRGRPHAEARGDFPGPKIFFGVRKSPRASARGQRVYHNNLRAGLQPGEDLLRKTNCLGLKPQIILSGLLPHAEARGDCSKPKLGHPDDTAPLDFWDGPPGSHHHRGWCPSSPEMNCGLAVIITAAGAPRALWPATSP